MVFVTPVVHRFTSEFCLSTYIALMFIEPTLEAPSFLVIRLNGLSGLLLPGRGVRAHSRAVAHDTMSVFFFLAAHQFFSPAKPAVVF
jgi:hypothetical protein